MPSFAIQKQWVITLNGKQVIMKNTIKLILALFSGIFAIGCTEANSSDKNENTVKVGDKLPAFTLKDQNGNAFSSTDYIGKKKIVIYFYPEDESGICTKEACAFRDSYAAFEDAGAIVVGINSGTVASHKAFQENHHLQFTLLSDPDNKVLKAFGIKNVLFLTGRETFVVDLSGKVVFNFRGFLNGDEHSKKALASLK